MPNMSTERAIDLSDPDLFVESVPHEIFKYLRDEQPAYYQEVDPTARPFVTEPFWNFTRYADCVAINRDWQHFSSALKTSLFQDFDPETLSQQQLMLVNMDPSMHTRYRLLVNKGFTPRMVNRLAESIRERTVEILDRAGEKNQVDFVEEVSAELPLQVIAEVLGVPHEDRRMMFDWSNQMIGAEDPEYQITPEKALEASLELYAYANKLAQERRVNPREDIATVLLNAQIDGDSLSELEFDLFFLLLTVAGNETTRNLISHGMLALMDNRDAYRRLVADPSLLPSAVEEMLRWASPVMHFRRTATEDVEIGGAKIKAGDKVVFWHISANYDERVFTDPYRFDIERSSNDHMAFGSGGPHFCLGANLARLEIRIMFEELLRRFPDIQPAGPHQRLRSNFINGIKHLPVVMNP
jgi:cholest-4-en-3-one 26-monooxygenase